LTGITGGAILPGMVDPVPADGPATVRVRTRWGQLDLVLQSGNVSVLPDNWIENFRIISALSHGDWILAEIEQTSAWIVIFSIRRDRE